ncbi:MAG TPA: endolytic transglycosylase MltG [Dehalococcoidia bacterium]
MTAYRVVVALFAVVTLALTGPLAWVVYNTPGSVFDDQSDAPMQPLPQTGESIELTIEKGESAADIGAELQSRGIIRSGRLFEVLVGLTGVQNSLEAGDYEFERNMTAIEAVHRIAEGRTASRQLTIPEGRRIEEVGETLDNGGIVKKQQFLDALDKTRYSEPFLAQVPAASLEGFVYPAGYEFNRDAGAAEIVDTMLRGFQDNVADRVQLEGQSMSLFDVVTLASIVEREAAVPEERGIIASVFLNRLRLGIALQADPTVQYAVADDPASVELYGWWKKELTLDDLKIDSPYNTYLYPGLPPGPIANPGLASIEAVVQPPATNFLFFVAKNDGTHVFAETLEEHLRNVEQYQR